MKFEIIDGILDYNITQLQPDTKYSVQVAALTRKGDGDICFKLIMMFLY